MKVIALISGGKDSCYNIMQCVAENHEIVALANLRPKDKDELDSYMYQTVGHHAIDLYAEAMGLPLYRRTIQGSSVEQGRDYDCVNPGDEVEDLYELLKEVKEDKSAEGVSVGAILSDYQRVRVEHVCGRLGLTVLGYLWRRDQKELLQEMINCKLHAIIIKVAALGLDPKQHLGKSLNDICPHMIEMNKKFGLNICGEGGEYETFTLDCPLFKKKIVLDEAETVIHSDDAFAPVGYLNLHKMHLENKSLCSDLSDMSELPMKHSKHLLSELFFEDELKAVVDNPKPHVSNLPRSSKYLTQGFPITTNISRTGYLWISNVTGLSCAGMNIEEITKTVMDTLKGILNDNGHKPSNVIYNHVYVRDMAQFAQINSVYKKYFGINPPARICVEASLAVNNVLQIHCLSYRGDESEMEKRTMHVQGLSHWAPANIGPFSQAVKLGDLVYVAGHIALCPASLKMVEGGIRTQCRLSLRHVSRVLQAMWPSGNLHHILINICYIIHPSYIKTAQDEWDQRIKQLKVDTEEWCFPLVEYVVVPALPRNALVEWQSCAFCGTHRYNNGSFVKRTDLFSATTKYFQYEGVTSQGLTLKVSVDCLVHSTVDADAVLDLFINVLQEILNRLDCSSGTLGGLRCFYNVNKIDAVQLSKACESLINSKPDGTSELMYKAAFVPVLGFSSDTCVASIVS